MKIKFVSKNHGKHAQVSRVLESHGFQVEIVAEELREPKTLKQRETVLEKAKQALELGVKPLFCVEDTGLFLDAYPDFPGTYTKFASKTIENKGFQKLLEGEDRGARFVVMVGLVVDAERDPFYFDGAVKGRIVERDLEFGSDPLPYNQIFVPDGETRTYSEIPFDERIKTGPRDIAYGKMAIWLKENLR
ncbi:MAG: non-canonical purine NTP pyrophosphatase [Candidatus Micrarchaeota archaeon]